MTFKGGSKGAKRDHAPPKKNAQKWHKIDIFLDVTFNKKTKQLLFIQVWSLLLDWPKVSEIRILFRNWGTLLKFYPSQSTLYGSAIDDLPTLRRFFYTKIVVHPKPK